MPRTMLAGRPYPQGSSWDGAGVNFAIYSENAERVELCLFESKDGVEERIPLPERTNHVWHGYLPGLQPGALYLYRAHGPWAPERGLRFNPANLLIDPSAKAMPGKGDWKAPTFPYVQG